MKWLFIPGWATTTDIFTPYKTLFKEYECYNWGFCPSHPKTNNEEIINQFKDEPYGILCHSMGTLKALQLSQTSKVKTIFSICGFADFCGEPPLSRKRALIINLMIKGLKTSPTKTLEDFYNNSKLSLQKDYASFDLDALNAGLIYLRDSNYSELSQSSKLDIHLIEGIQDSIVPAAISRKLLDGNGRRNYHELKGGHGILENNINTMSQLLNNIL